MKICVKVKTEKKKKKMLNIKQVKITGFFNIITDDCKEYYNFEKPTIIIDADTGRVENWCEILEVIRNPDGYSQY